MNSRFRECIKIMQQLDAGRISVLMSRICANPELDSSSPANDIGTDAKKPSTVGKQKLRAKKNKLSNPEEDDAGDDFQQEDLQDAKADFEVCLKTRGKWGIKFGLREIK